jgi:hypothetical protein
VPGTGGAGGYEWGTTVQDARLPTIRAAASERPILSTPLDETPTRPMTLLLLEALGALVLLVFIVWWTMFSGRQKGELPDAVEREKQEKKTEAPKRD